MRALLRVQHAHHYAVEQVRVRARAAEVRKELRALWREGRDLALGLRRARVWEEVVYEEELRGRPCGGANVLQDPMGDDMSD